MCYVAIFLRNVAYYVDFNIINLILDIVMPSKMEKWESRYKGTSYPSVNNCSSFLRRAKINGTCNGQQ